MIGILFHRLDLDHPILSIHLDKELVQLVLSIIQNQTSGN
jgi:hypothetical protein